MSNHHHQPSSQSNLPPPSAATAPLRKEVVDRVFSDFERLELPTPGRPRPREIEGDSRQSGRLSARLVPQRMEGCVVLLTGLMLLVALGLAVGVQPRPLRFWPHRPLPAPPRKLPFNPPTACPEASGPPRLPFPYSRLPPSYSIPEPARVARSVAKRRSPRAAEWHAGVVPKTIGIHVRTIQTNASPGSHYQEVALSAPHARIA
jgi:hypothetical protein